MFPFIDQAARTKDLSSNTPTLTPTSGIHSAKLKRRHSLFSKVIKPKPKLLKPNELVWPLKRDKINKCIYKHTSKMLTCKVKLELVPLSSHDSGPLPKLSLELHPYGTEEDANLAVTAKVTIEFPKKCRLHSERKIVFHIRATEDDALYGSEIGQPQAQQEKITSNFFLVKNFIVHDDLKKSQCEYVIVTAKVDLM